MKVALPGLLPKFIMKLFFPAVFLIVGLTAHAADPKPRRLLAGAATSNITPEIGAIIAPPLPAFYNQPKSIDDIIDHTVGRALDLFDIDVGLVKRWGQERP